MLIFLHLRRVVHEAGLARVCNLFWGEHTIQLYEVVAVAAWGAYSVHAPRGLDSVRVGLTLTDIFLDFQCAYQNTPTWRDKSAIEVALSNLYPKEKQLYVDLLHSARRLKTADQRDVIYSSLGNPLALGQDGKLMVVPDYTEPIDALHVRAARALLLNPREAPHTLLRVVHQTEEDLDDAFPTWAPRWTTFSDKDAQPLALTYTYEHRLNPYTSGGTNWKFAAQLLPDNVISVAGMRVDAVSWTSLPLRADNLRSNVSLWEPRFRDAKVSAVEVIWKSLLETSKRPGGELASEFSLVASRGRPDTRVGDHVDNFLAYCEHLRQLAGSEGPSPFPAPGSDRASPSNGELAMTRCRDRRVAYTTQGRLALVPLVAEYGDVCCIFRGMAAPVVLRQTSENMYRLVGDMYLDGVMDGELLQIPGQPPQWETLQIR